MCPISFIADWCVAANTCTAKADLAAWKTAGCTTVATVATPTGTTVNGLGAVTGCVVTCPVANQPFVVEGDLISVCFSWPWHGF